MNQSRCWYAVDCCSDQSKPYAASPLRRRDVHHARRRTLLRLQRCCVRHCAGKLHMVAAAGCCGAWVWGLRGRSHPGNRALVTVVTFPVRPAAAACLLPRSCATSVHAQALQGQLPRQAAACSVETTLLHPLLPVQLCVPIHFPPVCYAGTAGGVPREAAARQRAAHRGHCEAGQREGAPILPW